MSNEWKPRIVAFFCNWCTYTAADLAGVSRLKYAANIRVIRLMCSGRVDPQFILDALARGADGVLIVGSDKYSERHRCRTNGLNYLQTVHLGHLHVEKEQVGSQRVESAQRLRTVAAFTDDGHFGVDFEEPAERGARVAPPERVNPLKVALVVSQAQRTAPSPFVEAGSQAP